MRREQNTQSRQRRLRLLTLRFMHGFLNFSATEWSGWGQAEPAPNQDTALGSQMLSDSGFVWPRDAHIPS